MSAIDKVLAIAEAEIGYIEKDSPALLYDKTANAGDGNYTKYWQEILPSFQGQPWCACFVTWCMVQAFGRGTAANLLGHYPYTYVPTLAGLFEQYANPKRGDIVCFWNKNQKEFVHTGFVVSVNGDNFETIEGNTSGLNGIVPNGGTVRKKSYYNSALPGTKFIRPNYSICEEEEMTAEEKEKFNALVDKVGNISERIELLSRKIDTAIASVPKEKIYHYLEELPTEWEAREVIENLYKNGIYRGQANAPPLRVHHPNP